jgi:hypothetical protein
MYEKCDGTALSSEERLLCEEVFDSGHSSPASFSSAAPGLHEESQTPQLKASMDSNAHSPGMPEISQTTVCSPHAK